MVKCFVPLCKNNSIKKRPRITYHAAPLGLNKGVPKTNLTALIRPKMAFLYPKNITEEKKNTTLFPQAPTNSKGIKTEEPDVQDIGETVMQQVPAQIKVEVQDDELGIVDTESLKRAPLGLNEGAPRIKLTKGCSRPKIAFIYPQNITEEKKNPPLFLLAPTNGKGIIKEEPDAQDIDTDIGEPVIQQVPAQIKVEVQDDEPGNVDTESYKLLYSTPTLTIPSSPVIAMSNPQNPILFPEAPTTNIEIKTEQSDVRDIKVEFDDASRESFDIDIGETMIQQVPAKIKAEVQDNTPGNPNVELLQVLGRPRGRPRGRRSKPLEPVTERRRRNSRNDEQKQRRLVINREAQRHRRQATSNHQRQQLVQDDNFVSTTYLLHHHQNISAGGRLYKLPKTYCTYCPPSP